MLVRGDISRFVIIGQYVGAVSAHDRPLVADAGPILPTFSARIDRGDRIGWLPPVLALLRHGVMSDLSPLSGVIQTSHFEGVRTVFGPKADLAATAVVANSNGARVSILCRIIERE